MVVDNVLLGMDENIRNANTLFGLTLGWLHKDGYISETDMNDLLSKNAVILTNTSWFKRIFKSKKDKEHSWRYDIVAIGDNING